MNDDDDNNDEMLYDIDIRQNECLNTYDRTLTQKE